MEKTPAEHLDQPPAPLERGRPVHLFPLRFLGMGVFIAWLCCTHTHGVFPLSGTPTDAWNLVDYGMRIGDIATLLVLALAFGGRSLVSAHRKLSVALVAVSIVCAPLVMLWAIPAGKPEPLIFALSVMTAPGGAVLLLLWAEIYGQLGLPKVILYGSMSCLAAGGVSLVVYLMREPFGTVAAGLLPALSLACAYASLRMAPHEQARHTLVHRSAAVPWRLILVMALAGFVSSFYGSLMLQNDALGSFHRILATTLLGAAVLACTVFLKRGFELRLLACAVVPTAVAAIVLMPLVGHEGAAVTSFLAKFSYVGYTLFALAVLAGTVYRLSIPSLWIYGLARASSEGAMFAGILACRAVRDNPSAVGNPAFLWAVAAVGLAVVILCVTLWRNERVATSGWGVLTEEIRSGNRSESSQERLLRICGEAARRFGLTPREKDILTLLVQGKTARDIEGDLLLTQNTVKTHIRHIYTKLDVHSKTELVETFEKW